MVKSSSPGMGMVANGVKIEETNRFRTGDPFSNAPSQGGVCMTLESYTEYHNNGKSTGSRKSRKSFGILRFCDCGRHGGLHGIAPGCPGMADELLQFIPGDSPGTIRSAYDPDFVPEKPDAQGRVRLIPIPDDEIASPWPVVSTAELFSEFEQEMADRPSVLKDVKSLQKPFLAAFPSVPSTWPPIRDWLNTTFPGKGGRTRRNRYDTLRRVLNYGVRPLHLLPHSPLEDSPRPRSQSRSANPLSLEILSRLHDCAMESPLRDQAIWLCRFALGWRPVECVRLTLGDVRRAAASEDGYITREQKHRRGKESQSLSPIIPEVLDVLTQLAGSMANLADEAPIFYGTRGRHQGKPLSDQGVRGVVRKLFGEAGVRQEVPDAIPYDLRDSFAAHVGRAVRAGGGRVGEARDVARRLLGHGDGGDVLSRYYDDDERHLELLEYNPLRILKAGRGQVEKEGVLVEIEGLEPSASALRTPRSPN